MLIVYAHTHTHIHCVVQKSIRKRGSIVHNTPKFGKYLHNHQDADVHTPVVFASQTHASFIRNCHSAAHVHDDLHAGSMAALLAHLLCLAQVPHDRLPIEGGHTEAQSLANSAQIAFGIQIRPVFAGTGTGFLLLDDALLEPVADQHAGIVFAH